MDFPYIRKLAHWSVNFNSPGKNPYCLFLDLIGYSHEIYGECLYKGNPSDVLGFLELDMLIDALGEFRKSINADVYDFIDLLEREDEEYEN